MPGQRSGEDNLVQRRGRSHGRGNSRRRSEADRKIDARVETGIAPRRRSDMREPANQRMITDVSRLRPYRCTIIASMTSYGFVERLGWCVAEA